jgi:hypothetical protein
MDFAVTALHRGRSDGITSRPMRRRCFAALLVTSLAAAACGKVVDPSNDGGGGGDDDGTETDAGIDASPPTPDAQPDERRGAIEAFSRDFAIPVGAAVRDGRLEAVFGIPEARTCEIGGTDGNCILQRCTPRERPVRAPDAGPITFAVDGVTLTDLAPLPEGSYPVYERSDAPLFPDGALLGLSASGAEVPDFAIDLTAPTAIAIDGGEAPSSTISIQISAGAGHSIRWPLGGSTTDEVRATLTGPPDDDGVRKVLECRGLVSEGGYVFPVSLLTGLPVGPIEFEARVLSRTEVAAGGDTPDSYSVTFTAAVVARDAATGDWAKGMVDLIP